MTPEERRYLRDKMYAQLNYLALYETGYSRGRPRNGEVREPSPNAIKISQWRQKNAEKYRAMNLKYQKAWVARNKERDAENHKKRRLGMKQISYMDSLVMTRDIVHIGKKMGIVA
jgi:hypothetical protein